MSSTLVKGAVAIPVRGSERPMLVSAEDADLFEGLVLRLGPCGRVWAFVSPNVTSRIAVASRMLLGLAGSDLIVTHQNGDRLDCRRANLIVTERLRHLRSRRPSGESGYKGVFPAPSGRWRAQIHPDYESQPLGTFDTAEEAAAAYNRAAFQAWGDHAYLNPVDGWITPTRETPALAGVEASEEQNEYE